MAKIIFNIAAKQYTNFQTAYLSLMREQVQTDIPVMLSYTDGNGYALSAGQVLYSVLTPGQPGYFKITVANAVTLNSSGVINLLVSAYPTGNVPDGPVLFTIDGSDVILEVDYNSKPVTQDITKSRPNRSEYTFIPDDFTSAYNDFDGHALAEISATTNVENFTYNGAPYVAGTWIPIANVGQLKYVAPDVNTAVTTMTDWLAKDTQGHISE